MLTIEGVNHLHGTEHTMLPDMVEIGSWIGLAAMTKSEITIKNVNWNQLGIIPDTFRKLGIQLERSGEDIYIPAQEHYKIQKFIDGSILTVTDAPWPGFTPDLLSIVLVVATQAKGTVLVHQKMFESRLFFVDKLIDMGAQIILCDPHRATVVGLNHEAPLRGTTMTSPDIRAGNALLIAALSAEGKSIIHNIEQIDRGYENIDGRLKALGADIQKDITIKLKSIRNFLNAFYVQSYQPPPPPPPPPPPENPPPLEPLLKLELLPDELLLEGGVEPEEIELVKLELSVFPKPANPIGLPVYQSLV